MSPRVVTMIVLFVLSECVGAALGEWFFRLYLKAVPPMALSSFNSQSSRVVHLIYGLGVGFLLFLWALLGMVTGNIMRSMTKSPAKS